MSDVPDENSAPQEAAQAAPAVDQRTLRAFDRALQAKFGPLPPPQGCPIGWQPSPLAPVF